MTIDLTALNSPVVLARIADKLPAPTTCRFCEGQVLLVNNSTFYRGKKYGWPLAYVCSDCGARVGCHPGTDIPLGTLANAAIMRARAAAHKAFDPLWQGKGPGARRKAYRALGKLLGKPSHISWLDADDCWRVVELVKSGQFPPSEQTRREQSLSEPHQASLFALEERLRSGQRLKLQATSM